VFPKGLQQPLEEWLQSSQSKDRASVPQGLMSLFSEPSSSGRGISVGRCHLSHYRQSVRYLISVSLHGTLSREITSTDFKVNGDGSCCNPKHSSIEKNSSGARFKASFHRFVTSISFILKRSTVFLALLSLHSRYWT
jgi:hypothetical protein